MSSFSLTSRQNEANRLLGSAAKHIMLYGGSRSGKTFLLVRAIIIRALKEPGSRHVILRFRFNHVKTSVGLDTLPKVMKLCFPDIEYKLDKTDWYFKLPGGSEVWLGGLDEKDRVEKILGQEYSTIYLNECSQIRKYEAVETALTRLAQKTNLKNKMYYDCNPPGVGHWTYKLFVKKQKPNSKRDRLTNPDSYASMIINPKDNVDNIDKDYLETLGNMSEKKRKRFLDGLFLADYDNALWTSDIIDQTRIQENDLPVMRRVVVAVDPSGAKGKEDTRSDEIGIVVVGKGVDDNFYVLKDATLRGHPTLWGRIAVEQYHRYKADLIIAENNFGGEMVVSTIQSQDRTVNVQSRNAGSRGKVVRAEPVASLWGNNKASIVGNDMVDLEDQMIEMTTSGYMGSKSPDRCDAMCWGMLEVIQAEVKQELQFYVPG